MRKTSEYGRWTLVLHNIVLMQTRTDLNYFFVLSLKEKKCWWKDTVRSRNKVGEFISQASYAFNCCTDHMRCISSNTPSNLQVKMPRTTVPMSNRKRPLHYVNSSNYYLSYHSKKLMQVLLSATSLFIPTSMANLDKKLVRPVPCFLVRLTWNPQ